MHMVTSGRNTSQDPDYVGPTGHEKKFHKTHFGVIRTLKGSKSGSGYEWVRSGVGRWKLVKKEDKNETQYGNA